MAAVGTTIDAGTMLDTGGAADFFVAINTMRARRAGEMPHELAELLRKLVMGEPVERRALNDWGVQAMRIYEESDLPALVQA